MVVQIIDKRPPRPGFDRRRRRRQSETGKAKGGASYWQGDDGTVIRQDGTVETPVSAGLDFDFGAPSTATASANNTASSLSSAQHPTNVSSSSSPPLAGITCERVTPPEEERTGRVGRTHDEPHLQIQPTLASKLTPPEASVSVSAQLPLPAPAASLSAVTKLQLQIDFLEEQLQVRNKDMQSLQSDFHATKTQLSAAVSAHEHEQTVLDLQQENMKHTEMLAEQHERALQERDAANARTASQLKHACVVSQLQQEKQAKLELQLMQLQEQQSLQNDRDQQQHEKDQLLQHVAELEAKCAQNVTAANVLHANDLQQAIDKIAESDRKLLQAQEEMQRSEETHRQDLVSAKVDSDRTLLKAQEEMQLLEETHRQDLTSVKETYTEELQRREGDENQVVQELEVEEIHRQDLERAKETYTKELQRREEGYRQQRVQMEQQKEEEIAILRALLPKPKDSPSPKRKTRSNNSTVPNLQEELRVSEESRQRQHDIDLYLADETHTKELRKRDACHRVEIEEMQFALKVQTNEIAGLTTSLHELENVLLAQKAASETIVNDLQKEMKVLDKRSVRDLEEMKEEYTKELRKRDECHRQERENLEGTVTTKTRKMGAMEEALQSLEDSLKVELEKTTSPGASRPERRIFSHQAPTPKPFGPSSQVLDLEIVELAIASMPPPESLKDMKEKQSCTMEATRGKPQSSEKEPKDSEGNGRATAPNRRLHSSPKDVPAASAKRPNGRSRSADSKHQQRPGGNPLDDSIVHRTAFASNRASRSSLSPQLQSPKGRDRSADSKPRKRPSENPNPTESPVRPNSSPSKRSSSRLSLQGQSPIGRGRPADSKPRKRKRPSGNLKGVESPVHPNSSVSKRSSRRSSLQGSRGAVKPPTAKKARIVIESTGSDSDTVFSSNNL
jgi:hypothetical protein